MSFNGSNTVSVNHSTSLILSGTKATISTWLKVSSHNSTYREILRKASGGTGYFLLLNAANKIALSTTNSAGEYNNGIAYAADGLWHNVVAILNGSTCFINIDGVQQTSYACGTISDDGSLLYLASSANTVQFLTGSLDDVRIYNRALTAQDVYMLYLSDNRIRNAVMNNVQFK